VLKSIGGFIVERFDIRDDGVHSELDRWPRGEQRGPAAKKYPFDDPTQAGGGATQHQQITVASPHSTSGNYCDLLVSWDYNGRWLTNVNITRGAAHGVPVLERLDYTFSVSAKIEDVPGGFAAGQSNDPPCGAVRINIEWREVRPVLDNVLVTGTLTLFGNGGYMLSYSHEQGDLEHVVTRDIFVPPGGMRSVGQTAQAHSLEATPPVPVPAPAPTATTVTRASETRGTVRFDLDQFQGVKQPPSSANGATPMQTVTVPVPGPRATDLPQPSETYGDCELVYDFDGHALGNVRVRPTGADGTRALVVVESITDDPQTYALPGSPDQLAALRMKFEYVFDQMNGKPLTTDVVLYGNGRQDFHYDWPHS
jgi:hypothetical protein